MNSVDSLPADLGPSLPFTRVPTSIKSSVFDSPTLNSLNEFDLPLTAPPSPSLPYTLSLPIRRPCSLPVSRRPSAPIFKPPTFTIPEIFSEPLSDLIASFVTEVDYEFGEPQVENAFFVCDLAEIYRANVRWEAALGNLNDGVRRVEPFFAVKCNPDLVILKLLAALGLGFDCASQSEIAAVLSLGVDPSRIIYANPCKAASFIRHAQATQVDLMTFDNTDELFKISRHHPKAKLVLRILTDDTGSVCRLGLKFGAPLSAVKNLLIRARELHLSVVGVSFHVGSGCTNPALYRDAISRCRNVFDVAAKLGYKFNLLDIGGGFTNDTFEIMAKVIKVALSDYFPIHGSKDAEDLRVIAEPGRFYVTEAFELATNIIARRGISNDGEEESLMTAPNSPITPSMLQSLASRTGLLNPAAAENESEETMVMCKFFPTFQGMDDNFKVTDYINEGVYGVFNCIMFDHQVVHPVPLTLDGGLVPYCPSIHIPTAPCSIWGPTCDAIDIVCSKTLLPTERLEVGDWLLWQNMGAYTICAASQFNGFRKSLVYYTVDAKGEEKLTERVRSLVVLPINSRVQITP